MRERPKHPAAMLTQSLVDIAAEASHPVPRGESAITGAMPYLGKEVMTNFDHSIEDGAEDMLRQSDGWADYPGWNFHGRVWHEGEGVGEFCCEVWQYHQPREIIRAATLQELMNAVSAEYGDD